MAKTKTEENVATPSDTISVDLYNMNHTKSGRMPTNSSYLDDEENIHAEVQRARAEDRDADLSDVAKLPPSAGTQLRPWAALPEAHANHSNVLSGDKDNEDAYVKIPEPVQTVDVELNPATVTDEGQGVDGSASPAGSGAAESDSGKAEVGPSSY